MRHDAVYVEMPNKQPYILVVFTEGKEHSQNRELLPFISERIALLLLIGKIHTTKILVPPIYLRWAK